MSARIATVPPPITPAEFSSQSEAGISAFAVPAPTSVSLPPVSRVSGGAGEPPLAKRVRRSRPDSPSADGWGYPPRAGSRQIPRPSAGRSPPAVGLSAAVDHHEIGDDAGHEPGRQQPEPKLAVPVA